MDVSKLSHKLGDFIYYGSKSYKPDEELAFKFYNFSAVNVKRPESIFSIGYLYEKGEGVKMNKTKAME